mgnify:CR=1 FL=1
MKITDFYNTEYLQSALYQSFRSIANYIDGLKPSGRKVIYTVDKNNIQTKLKSSQLCSKVAEETQYLHGEQSLSGVVVGLAQKFVGSNNINILMPEGNFGSRYINEPSASRYIYTQKSEWFDKIFHPSDKLILDEQYFEGEKIEYKYYVPVLPLILINGCEGIGNGFAQKILPRKIEDVKKEIETKLTSPKYKVKSLTPYFEGFKGKVKPNSEPHKWIVEGCVEKLGAAKLQITEIPIGYELKQYIDILDDLVDKKVIKSYDDNSKDDKFDFTIYATKEFISKPEEEILNELKLVKVYSENYTCTDENNAIKEFDSDSDILEAFIDVRLKYYTKRKKALLDDMESKLKVSENRLRFIKAVIDKPLLLVNKKKADVEKWLKKEEFDEFESYDYLLKMPMYSLTIEKFNDIEKEYQNLKKEFDILEKKTPKKLWLDDLDRF